MDNGQVLSALFCAVSAAPSHPIIVPDLPAEHAPLAVFHAPVAYATSSPVVHFTPAVGHAPVVVDHAPVAYATPSPVAHSAPVAVDHAPVVVQHAPVAVVTSQSHAQDELGQYSYSYSNPHSSKSETKTLDGVTRGGYAYVDSHGLVQNVNYVSDDVNGFRVAASNLPLGPVEPQKDEPLVAHEKAKAVAALHHAALKDSVLDHENNVAPVYVESHEEVPVVAAAPAYVSHPAPTDTYDKVHSTPAPPTYVENHSTPVPPTYVEKHATLGHYPAYVKVHSTPAPEVYVTPAPIAYASPSATPLVSHAPSPYTTPLYHRSAPIAHVEHAPFPTAEVHVLPYHREAPSPLVSHVPSPTHLPEHAPTVHATPSAYSYPEHAHSYATVELDLSDVPAPHHAPGEYFRPAPAAISHAPLVVSSTPAPEAYEQPAAPVIPSPTPVLHEVPTPTVYATPSPVVHAAPVAVDHAPVVVEHAPVAVVSSQSHAQDELGQYSYSYSNPLSAKVETKTLDGVTRGGYAYVDSHGLVQNVNYVSDDHHGFRVAASNLPSPAIPVDIPDSHDVAAAKEVFFAEIAKAKAAVAYAH